MGEFGPLPEEYSPRENKTSARRRWILALFATFGIETGLGAVINHAHKEQTELTLENKIRQAFSDAQKTGGLFSPDWNSDPEEFEEQLTFALSLLEKAEAEKQVVPHLDNGLLTLSYLEADGKISAEETQELQSILEQKRKYYSELTKTKNPLEVLHIIIQNEHKQYVRGASSLPQMLREGVGDCEGTAEGLNAIIEGVWPEKERAFAFFTSQIDKDLGHVALLVEMEKGLWYRTDENMPTPFVPEPGIVISKTSEFSKALADQMVKAKNIQPDETNSGATIGSNPELTASIKNEKSPLGLLHKLSSELPKPTAVQPGSAETQPPHEVLSFEEATLRLKNTEPAKAAAIASAKERMGRVEDNFDSYPFYKGAGFQTLQEKEGDVAVKIDSIVPFVLPKCARILDDDSLSEEEKYSQLEPLFEKLGWHMLNLDNLIKPLWGKEAVIYDTLSPDEQIKSQKRKEALIAASKRYLSTYTQTIDSIKQAVQNGIISEQGQHTHLNLEQLIELFELSKTGKKVTVFCLPNNPIYPTGKYFSNVDFADHIKRLDIYSLEKNQDSEFMKRFAGPNKSVVEFTITAPHMADFSGLKNVYFQYSPKFKNIPGTADLGTLDYQALPPETNDVLPADQTPQFENPASNLSFENLPAKMHGNLKIILNKKEMVANIAQRDKTQFENVGELEITAFGLPVDTTIFESTSKLKFLTITDPSPVQDWSFIKNIKNPDFVLYIETNSIEKFWETKDGLNQVLELSKKYPNTWFSLQNSLQYTDPSSPESKPGKPFIPDYIDIQGGSHNLITK